MIASIALAAAAHALPGSVDSVPLRADLAAQCESPRPEVVDYSLRAPLPVELVFLLGSGTLNAVGIDVAGQHWGAGGDGVARAQTPEYRVTATASGTEVVLRIQTSEAQFCADRLAITVTYELRRADAIVGAIDVRGLPGVESKMNFQADGRRLALRAIDRRFANELHFYLDREARWFNAYQKDQQDFPPKTLRQFLSSSPAPGELQAQAQLRTFKPAKPLSETETARALGTFLASVNIQFLPESQGPILESWRDSIDVSSDTISVHYGEGRQLSLQRVASSGTSETLRLTDLILDGKSLVNVTSKVRHDLPDLDDVYVPPPPVPPPLPPLGRNGRPGEQ